MRQMRSGAAFVASAQLRKTLWTIDGVALVESRQVRHSCGCIGCQSRVVTIPDHEVSKKLGASEPQHLYEETLKRSIQMPLIAIAISPDIVPKSTALFWHMQSGQQPVQIYVNRSALATLRDGEIGDLAIFGKNRILLEAIADRKFDRDGADNLGNVSISKEDLMDLALNPE